MRHHWISAATAVALLSAAVLTPTVHASAEPDRVVVADDAIRPAKPISARELAALEAGGDDGSSIDLLIAFTAAALADAGSLEALRSTIDTGVAQANEAFRNSGVATQVNLVGVVPTATAEVRGDLLTDYRRIGTPGDGFYDDVLAERDRLHADLVSVWMGGAYDVCGRGGLGPEPTQGFVSMIFVSCATGWHGWAHEIGHNLGGDHEADAGYAPSTPVADARGYVDHEARWYTLMAYGTTCHQPSNPCTPILHISNPAVSYGGRPTGTAAANNARIMNANRVAVANYRASRLYPGTPTVPAATAGVAVTATPGNWAPASTALTYQWLVDGVPVAGAGATFIPEGVHAGRSLSVQVTGSAPHYGPVTVTSAPTIIARGKIHARRPALKGKARVGRTLKVAKGRWQPTTGISFSYQWLRDGKKIKGKKGKRNRYRLTRRDRGHKISVVLRGSAEGYASARSRSRAKRVR